jgi:hypothetical protein
VRELFAASRTTSAELTCSYNSAGLNDREDHSVLDMPLPVRERVLAAKSHHNLSVLQTRHPPHVEQRSAKRVGHQHRVVSGRDGRGQRTDGLLRRQGRSSAAQPRPGRPPRHRAVRVNALVLGPSKHLSCGRCSRTSAKTRSLAGSCTTDGPLRHARRDCRHSRVPRQQRRRLHHRRSLPTGRRHHLGVHGPVTRQRQVIRPRALKSQPLGGAWAPRSSLVAGRTISGRRSVDWPRRSSPPRRDRFCNWSVAGVGRRCGQGGGRTDGSGVHAET